MSVQAYANSYGQQLDLHNLLQLGPSRPGHHPPVMARVMLGLNDG